MVNYLWILAHVSPGKKMPSTMPTGMGLGAATSPDTDGRSTSRPMGRPVERVDVSPAASEGGPVSDSISIAERFEEERTSKVAAVWGTRRRSATAVDWVGYGKH